MRHTSAAVLFLLGAAAAQETVDFQEHIQPILRDHCWKCHGPKKQEGDLRLDLRRHAFHEDEDLWVIVPGSPVDSLLYERVTLPHDDPDIMPAEGEPLTAEQIALLERWIAQGAAWPEAADAAVLAAEERRRAREVIDLPELTEDQREREADAIAAVTATGALCMRIAANTAAVEANFSLIGDRIGDEQLAALDGLQPTLLWLNLARTRVTDAGLARLADFARLRKLNLSNTAIGDAGLAHLRGLDELEYLNLYGTRVTDAGLAHLHDLPALRKVFLWQSGVTEAGAAALAEALPDTQVDVGGHAEAMLATLDAPAEPVNELCPVTGKPVDPGVTSSLDGELVAFCCAECKAKFDADPDAFREKVRHRAARAPVNELCPVTGKPVDPAVTSSLDGELVAFCCADCKAKFDADPEAFREQVRRRAARAPVNELCPVTGKPVDPGVTSSLDGELIAFCCADCKAKFDADPDAFREKVQRTRR